MKRTRLLFNSLVLALFLPASGWTLDSRYQKPLAPVTRQFKEPLPEGWKQAEPGDGRIAGKW
jgi:hypothetical protein